MRNKPLLITATIALAFYIAADGYVFFPKYKTVTLPNGTNIKTEVADNIFKQTQGLRNRKSLSPNIGMLFIFSDVSKHVFWMKDTLIPLDFIWLDESLKIVDLTYNAQPCAKDPCKLFMPAKPVKYVVETSANTSQDLKIGDQLKLN